MAIAIMSGIKSQSLYVPPNQRNGVGAKGRLPAAVQMRRLLSERADHALALVEDMKKKTDQAIIAVALHHFDKSGLAGVTKCQMRGALRLALEHLRNGGRV